MVSLRKACPNGMPSLKGMCSNACYVQLLLTIQWRKKNFKNVAGKDSTEKHTMGCI